jgi:hypothetical protein
MKLITAHRILIGAGIAFFLFYAMVVLMRDHTVSGFVHALVSLAVAVGLTLYYRMLKGMGLQAAVLIYDGAGNSRTCASGYKFERAKVVVSVYAAMTWLNLLLN